MVSAEALTAVYFAGQQPPVSQVPWRSRHNLSVHILNLSGTYHLVALISILPSEGNVQETFPALQLAPC